MSRDRVLRLVFALALLIGLTAAPALADFRLEREFPLAAGGRFVLDSALGTVELHGTSGSSVHVVITSSKDDIENYVRFDFEASSDRVEVRGEKLRKLTGLFSWFGSHRLKYEIEVPSSAEVHVSTAGGSIEVGSLDGRVELETSGGGVVARGIGGMLEIDTSGGSIEIEDVRADAKVSTSGGSIEATSVTGNLDAETSGGNIRVREVTGEVDAETSGGSIRVEGIGGRLRAETSGGSITATLAPGNGFGGELSTSGGSIRVTLPAGVGVSLDAHCSGGRVSTELPVTVTGTQSKDTLRGDLNGGGESLRLRTSGGSIVIEQG